MQCCCLALQYPCTAAAWPCNAAAQPCPAAAAGHAMLLPALQWCLQCCCRPCNAAASHAILLPGPCNAAAGHWRSLQRPATHLLGPQCCWPCNRAWSCRDLLAHDHALTMVFDPDIGSDIGSDHVTRSCYSIMLLIHVTRSCYSFLLLDPVTHSCYSIRSVLIDSPQQSNPLYDRSHFRPCRFNRQVHASVFIFEWAGGSTLRPTTHSSDWPFDILLCINAASNDSLFGLAF